MVAKRNTSHLDWELIEKEYRTAQLSVNQLATKYGLACSTITRRAKKEGWIRDLSDEVSTKTRAALLAGERTDAKDVVQAAVTTNVEVIREHLREDEKYFTPTPEWDKDQSWDRTWS